MHADAGGDAGKQVPPSARVAKVLSDGMLGRAGWQLTITSSIRSNIPALRSSSCIAAWSRAQDAATSSAPAARRS